MCFSLCFRESCPVTRLMCGTRAPADSCESMPISNRAVKVQLTTNFGGLTHSCSTVWSHKYKDGHCLVRTSKCNTFLTVSQVPCIFADKTKNNIAVTDYWQKSKGKVKRSNQTIAFNDTSIYCYCYGATQWQKDMQCCQVNKDVTQDAGCGVQEVLSTHPFRNTHTHTLTE